MMNRNLAGTSVRARMHGRKALYAEAADVDERRATAVRQGVMMPIRDGSGGGDYGRVFTGLLFALFVAVLLLAIVAGTQIYRSLAAFAAAANDERAAIGLVVNSVRAQDSLDCVQTGQGPEGPSLVLVERLASGTYETRFYLSDGAVVQEYALADAAYAPEKATMVAKSDTFDFAFDGGLLTVVTDEGQAQIALRSAEGGGPHGDA